MPNEYEKLSEEEIERKIANKYGKDWNIDDVDDSDPLIIAFFEKTAKVE